MKYIIFGISIPYCIFCAALYIVWTYDPSSYSWWYYWDEFPTYSDEQMKWYLHMQEVKKEYYKANANKV